MPKFQIHGLYSSYSFLERFNTVPSWRCPPGTKCFAGAIFWLLGETNFRFLHEHANNGPDTRVYQHRGSKYMVKRVP